MSVEVCGECGFDGSAWSDTDAIAAVAALPGRWSEAFDGLTDADLQRRPIPTMWSIVEYADHVREVLFGMRFLSDTAVGAPGTDLGHAPEPVFAPEPRPIDIGAALSGLSAEAEQLTAALAAAPPTAWGSSVVVDGERVDLHWIVRHAVHDPTHHLRDVARLRAAL